MNNKPVVWMNSKGNVIPNDVREAEKVDDFVFNSYTIPLYTHPAKTLTMTFEEMNYKITCVYDDMTVVIENGVEISRVYQDNRIKYNPFELLGVPK